MTKVAPWQLGFMFACTAAGVFVMAYRYVWAYPAASIVGAAAVLAVLGRWYAVARRGNDEVLRSTVRRLSLAIVVLVLVVPYLLRVLHR